LYKKAGWGRIFPLAVGLAKLGNDVTIITTNENYSIFRKVLYEDNVRIIVFPEIIPSRVSRLGFGFLSLIRKLIFVLFHNFDVVQTDNGHRPLAGIPSRVHQKVHKSIYVAEWYDWYGVGGQYDLKNKIFKIVLGRYELKYEIKDKVIADGVVVLSEVLRKRMLGIDPNKMILKLHGGADVSAIPYLSDNREMKIKYNINPDVVTFGYIDAFSGNLREVQPLIDAIIETNNDTKCKLLLFGRVDSIEDTLPDRIKNLIVNVGWVDFKRDYEKLQCVDVFVMFKENSLSNNAGWPNCLGDYLACGRPVFLNPVGEVIEFVNTHSDGFYVCSLEKESIGSRVVHILVHTTELVQKGLFNRNVAENEISWDKRSIALLEFYKQLIVKKGKRIHDNI
jgi:glycosyltransferase involved in cell wall biosynthesis